MSLNTPVVLLGFVAEDHLSPFRGGAEGFILKLKLQDTVLGQQTQIKWNLREFVVIHLQYQLV